MKLRKEEKTRAADHFLILTIISQPVSSSNLHNIFIQTQEFYPPPPDSLCALLLQYAATASSNLASTVRFFQIFSRLIRFSSRFTSASFFISSSSSSRGSFSFFFFAFPFLFCLIF